MNKKIAIILILLLSTISFIVPSDNLVKPKNFYTDKANILNNSQKKLIIKINQILKTKTGAEIAILTETSLEENDSFNYSVSVFEAWKPGNQNKDNGILIMVVKNNKRIEVRTGYGVEGILPDGKIGRYIDKYFVPLAKNNKIGEGIINLTYIFGSEIAQKNGFSLKNHLQSSVSAGTQKRTENLKGKAALPGALIILLVILYIFPPTRPFAIMLFLILLRRGGGFGSSGGFGGGFGGFGGGSTGGGGAGRSW